MEVIKHILDVAEGKHPSNVKRSSQWPAVRKHHLEEHPNCAVCGGTEHLEVHHIRPFHLHPELELEPTNFITLCESGKGGINCHLAAGHLGSYKSFNPNVVADSAYWSERIKSRPLVDA
jgi:5-methylcytosine-specific restriction endonuclease McrA